MPIRQNSAAIHLYHATLPPRIVFSEEEKKRLMEKGYSESYIHQEYPKHIPFGHGRIVVRNRAEEEEIMRRLKKLQGDVND